MLSMNLQLPAAQVLHSPVWELQLYNLLMGELQFLKCLLPCDLSSKCSWPVSNISNSGPVPAAQLSINDLRQESRNESSLPKIVMETFYLDSSLLYELLNGSQEAVLPPFPLFIPVTPRHFLKINTILNGSLSFLFVCFLFGSCKI